MDFAEYLRKLDVSGNSKIYYVQFVPNGLNGKYCYISSWSWNVEYPGKSAGHWKLVKK